MTEGTPRHTTACSNPASAQDLRHLRDVAEHVGQVADLHGPTERRAPQQPALEVADDRLARDEELVHEDVPRAHRQPPRRRQGADPVFVLGPDLEVVVDHRHLPVEEEPGVGGVALEQGDEPVEHLHEPQPEALVRLVPLPVPVGMGHDGDVPLALVNC